jgi:arsenate reductase (thioredoxin)
MSGEGMKKILFICTHNGARSQMAEALCKQSCGDLFQVASAGTQPGQLNPLAVEVMAELGIDISHNETKSIFPFMRERPGFNFVISVCDEGVHEQCPTFPAGARYVQWSFPDPSKFTGTQEEKLAQTREVRDAIKARITEWCAEMCIATTA